MKSAGVDSSDIQTSQVSLWPQTSNDGNTITGYQASNTVTVTAPVGKSGNLVDQAVSAGANNVDGPNLSVSDTSDAYAAAMKKAVADAQSKAQAIASASGLTLGGIVHISDDGSSTPGPIAYAMDASAREGRAADRGRHPADPGDCDGDVLGEQLDLGVPGLDAVERPAVRLEHDPFREHVGLRRLGVLARHSHDDLMD